MHAAAAAVLKAENCEPVFAQKISRAVVYHDRINFVFREGTVETWQRE